VNPLRACLLALAPALPVAAPAQAGQAPVTQTAENARQPQALAGHYFLEGVMETGSELLLDADGRFQWYFSYGALDLAAKGRWRHEGGQVVLVPEDFAFPPQYPETRFERMTLRVEGADLVPAWPWEGGAGQGRYVRDESK
jgi:hypothetical protein